MNKKNIQKNKYIKYFLIGVTVFALFSFLGIKQVDASSGTLSCQTVDSTTIRLSYTTTNGSNVHLFRGSTAIVNIGSGNNSNTVQNSNLSPGTSYTFYLRNGSSSSATMLAHATCTTSSTYVAPTPTPTPSASGTLSCQTVDSTTIRLSYTTTNGSNVHLFRGSTAIVNIGSGNNSNTVQNSNLSPGTSYTFYLRNGSSSSATMLAHATCTTSSTYVAPTPTPSASGTSGGFN